MPSHLTRVVFRSIVANKPLIYRGCLHRTSRPRIVLQHGLRTLPQSQRRTFFDFFKPQRKVKSAELPPGLDKLMDLAHMQNIVARPPPPAEVAQAFNVFFSQKDKTHEDFHIAVAQNAFKYLQKHPREDAQPWFSLADIRAASWSLLKPPETGGKPHLAFARLLHEELEKRQETDESETAQGSKPTDYEITDLPLFAKLLSLYGASLEAREIAAKAYSGHICHIEILKRGAMRWVWTSVLQGLAREKNAEELLKTAEIMREQSVPFLASMQSVLVTFFAQNDLEQAKYWYSQPILGLKDGKERDPPGQTYAAILKACALSGDLPFGQQVVASLLKRTPNKAAWDAIFIWSAAIGKGVDEVDRMMGVMVRRNDESRQKNPSIPVIRPDIDTINALVEFSMSKQDPYSAERYITLGEKRGIIPNEQTFTMQVQYRLSIKDVDGARAAYFGLQGNMTRDERSVEAVNQLVQALCQSKQHHFDDIMAIVDDLHERKARLAPETVAALCVLHLRRGEGVDAMDVLQVHAHHFSPPQRTLIRNQLVVFLLDGQNSTADAWDAYQILRQVFPETPRDSRTRIMNEFFARKRSDMACHVFFHMRNHPHKQVNPNNDVYAAAFTGFARNGDAESLELAHNQLKLDLNVEMDTKMRNALMLAYAATGNNRRALEFWSEIVASKEGPTYNSIAIAFRSCEGMPFGDEHAKPIWRRLKEMDMDIDKQIFTAYLGAIARNQLHDEAVAMLESVEEEYGFTPDLFILGNWFNATTNIERQAKVEAWIREHYPAVWTELDALGHWVTMDGFGYRQYNINRDLDP